MWTFLKYNNAVPIALGIIFLGSGITFAATNPDAVYSSQQQVISVDNTYIANKDLSSYSPQAQITGVTEDDENYYVAYDFMTIDLVNSTWQDTTKQITLKVSKASLSGSDLGLFVAEQLKENVDADLQRLRDTQLIEKKNVTQKTVATVYGGLVGKMLNSSTETLPGYTPVIAPAPVSLASDASTTPVTDTSVSSTTVASVSTPPAMTQEQIQQYIQQQVDLMLSQHTQAPPSSGGGSNPPVVTPPVTTPDTDATSTDQGGAQATSSPETVPADDTTPPANTSDSGSNPPPAQDQTATSTP